MSQNLRPSAAPTLRTERALFAVGHPFVLGCDEVGRGALAGPVTVAMVLLDVSVGQMPTGLRDSKLLAEPRRERLAPSVGRWVRGYGVGDVAAADIDAHGIMASLGQAGARAFSALLEAVPDVAERLDGVPLILDGNHDWLSAVLAHRVAVTTRVKADRDCATVAGASVLAKVHRDRAMRAHHTAWPAYGWDENKGYGTRGHRAALERCGPSPLHRTTWWHPERSPTGDSGPAA